MVEDTKRSQQSAPYLGFYEPWRENASGSILFATDSHLWSNPPINRRGGNYSEDIISKLIHVFIYAMENRIDVVALGGDITDRPSIPIRLWNPVAAAMVDYLHRDGTIAIVPGNHDVEGYDLNTFLRGALGGFHLLGALSDNRVVIGYDKNKPWGICTLRTHQGIRIAMVPEPPPAPTAEEQAQNLMEILVCMEELSNIVDVFVLHLPIHSSDNHPEVHLHPSDIPVRPGQVALVGHIHERLGVMKSDLGGSVVIPGALARRDYTEGNRIPTMAHVVLGGSIDLVTVPHRPGSEVFVSPPGGTRREEIADRMASAAESYRESLLHGSRVDPRTKLRQHIADEPQDVQHAALEDYDEAANQW